MHISNPTSLPVRPLLWLGFFGMIIGAWAWLYAMSRGMGMTLTGGMAEMGRMGMTTQMSMDGMSGGLAMGGMTTLAVLLPMWIIMMAAMMGPTFVPTARTYEDLINTGVGTRAGLAGLVAGYLLIWFAFGLLIGLAHYALLSVGWLSAMGRSTSALFSAALLLIAGLYQFTRIKDRCLAYCRTPMVHFLRDWRPGGMGGAVMGARIGAYCVPCCWAIMSIGFVGGAMNLIWMGVATLLMTLEKLPALGLWLTRPLGLAFLGTAAWQASLAI